MSASSFFVVYGSAVITLSITIWTKLYQETSPQTHATFLQLMYWMPTFYSSISWFRTQSRNLSTGDTKDVSLVSNEYITRCLNIVYILICTLIESINPFITSSNSKSHWNRLRFSSWTRRISPSVWLLFRCDSFFLGRLTGFFPA